VFYIYQHNSNLRIVYQKNGRAATIQTKLSYF
jgi:hypothetical protein